MVNKKRWMSGFRELDPDDQIIVAEAIVEELGLNEETFDDDDELYDEDDPDARYDQDKSARVRKLFENMIAHGKDTQKLQQLNRQIHVFETFSPEIQAEFLDEILRLVEKYTNKQDQAAKEAVCSRDGHQFGEWDSYSWTENAVVWDAGPQGTVEVEHTKWYRVCQRCGFKETQDYEPLEVAEAREKAEKKARIKSLRAELAQLEGKK